jgi:hypothetical protein
LTAPIRRLGWYRASDNHEPFEAAHYTSTISDELWIEYNRIRSIVTFISPFVIDYQSLHDDFCELIDFESKYADLLGAAGHEPFLFAARSTILLHAKAQRAISNFLGAASAFRDRSVSRLSELYGKEASQITAFKEKISCVYDASFAYRVLYNLRNHSQHWGSPITVVPIRGSRPSPESPIAYNVQMLLNANHLADSKLVQPKVKAELLSLGKTDIELIPLCAFYMSHHACFIRHIIESHSDRLLEAHAWIRQLRSEIGCPPGAIPVIWEGEVPSAGSTAKYGVHTLAMDALFLFAQVNDDADELCRESDVACQAIEMAFTARAGRGT